MTKIRNTNVLTQQQKDRQGQNPLTQACAEAFKFCKRLGKALTLIVSLTTIAGPGLGLAACTNPAADNTQEQTPVDDSIMTNGGRDLEFGPINPNWTTAEIDQHVDTAITYLVNQATDISSKFLSWKGTLYGSDRTVINQRTYADTIRDIEAQICTAVSKGNVNGKDKDGKNINLITELSSKAEGISLGDKLLFRKKLEAFILAAYINTRQGGDLSVQQAALAEYLQQIGGNLDATNLRSVSSALRPQILSAIDKNWVPAGGEGLLLQQLEDYYQYKARTDDLQQQFGYNLQTARAGRNITVIDEYKPEPEKPVEARGGGTRIVWCGYKLTCTRYGIYGIHAAK